MRASPLIARVVRYETKSLSECDGPLSYIKILWRQRESCSSSNHGANYAPETVCRFCWRVLLLLSLKMVLQVRYRSSRPRTSLHHCRYKLGRVASRCIQAVTYPAVPSKVARVSSGKWTFSQGYSFVPDYSGHQRGIPGEVTQRVSRYQLRIYSNLVHIMSILIKKIFKKTLH